MPCTPNCTYLRLQLLSNIDSGGLKLPIIPTVLDFSSLPSSFSVSSLRRETLLICTTEVCRPDSGPVSSLQQHGCCSGHPCGKGLALGKFQTEIQEQGGFTVIRLSLAHITLCRAWISAAVQSCPVSMGTLLPVVVAQEFVCGSWLQCNKGKRQLASPEDDNRLSKLPYYSF